MRKAKTIIACMAALAVLVAVQSESAQGKLQGVWKIRQVTLTGSNGRTITDPQPGFIIFTKQHAAMVSIMGYKPRPDMPQLDATDAQKVATWTPFCSAAGTYKVEGTAVTFHPIAAKNPFEPGAFTTFVFGIEGDTLYLMTNATKSGPVADPITLQLTRVE